MTSRALTLYQSVIAVVALAGVTLLAALDKVSADAAVSIYSLVIGAALGVGVGVGIVKANGRLNGGSSSSSSGGSSSS